MKTLYTHRASAGVRILLVLLALLLVAGFAAGCAGDGDTPPPDGSNGEEPTDTVPPDDDSEEPADATTDLYIYLVRGETLGVAMRTVPQTVAVAEAALNELLAGPTEEDVEAGLASEVPEGTELLGVSISDGVATVDLSPEFEAGGGSLSMQLRVAQVVFTLTRFPTVDTVAFEIDGAPVEAIGGEGVVVSPPVSRAAFADNTLPAILVESPAPWEEVSSPLRVTGMSNTFEAAFAYEVVDQAGLIVAEGSGMATAGTGTWGTFDVTIPFEITREGIGSLIVFEYSAKDGSRVNLVEIPLRFAE